MQSADTSEQIASMRETIKAHDVRIGKLEQQDTRVATVIGNIERMQYQIDTLLNELKAAREDLESIKTAPAKRMISIEGAAWAALVGGLVSMWLSRMS